MTRVRIRRWPRLRGLVWVCGGRLVVGVDPPDEEPDIFHVDDTALESLVDDARVEVTVLGPVPAEAAQ